MGLSGQTARGTRAAIGAVTSCTGLTNPISPGVRCMMIAGLSIKLILASKRWRRTKAPRRRCRCQLSGPEYLAPR